MKISNLKFYIISRGDLYFLDSLDGYFKFNSKGKPKLFARKTDAKKAINKMTNYCYDNLQIKEVKITIEGVL